MRSHLDERSQSTLFSLLETSSMVARSLKDLSPAHVPVNHYLKLRDNRPTHHRPRRMASKHKKLIRKELNNLLDADTLVLMSAP